jgi:hypothetical protein
MLCQMQFIVNPQCGLAPIKAVALLVVDALVIGLRKPTIEDYLNRLPYSALMLGRGPINRYPAIRTMLRKSMSTSPTIAW